MTQPAHPRRPRRRSGRDRVHPPDAGVDRAAQSRGTSSRIAREVFVEETKCLDTDLSCGEIPIAVAFHVGLAAVPPSTVGFDDEARVGQVEIDGAGRLAERRQRVLAHRADDAGQVQDVSELAFQDGRSERITATPLIEQVGQAARATPSLPTDPKQRAPHGLVSDNSAEMRRVQNGPQSGRSIVGREIDDRASRRREPQSSDRDDVLVGKVSRSMHDDRASRRRGPVNDRHRGPAAKHTIDAPVPPGRAVRYGRGGSRSQVRHPEFSEGQLRRAHHDEHASGGDAEPRGPHGPSDRGGRDPGVEQLCSTHRSGLRAPESRHFPINVPHGRGTVRATTDTQDDRCSDATRVPTLSRPPFWARSRSPLGRKRAQNEAWAKRGRSVGAASAKADVTWLRESVGMSESVVDISRFPFHLGLGATVDRLDEFDGSMDWYERYGAATESDGVEGRLVSMHTFDAPWDSWEVHPAGHELVVCISGRLVVIQEVEGEVRTVPLTAGQAVVNEPGVWHTADVDERTTALFITAGTGTEVRPR